ncbi:MAG: chromosome segregation protein [Sphingomonas bacterium]|nr:chromosome segregation protein SMC [Sphingomonas bacterium]MDB5689057.1 chromosome segregation protein [Sphingomonas bacterium]
MRIKRLKLSGFKSFVEPAELRIEPGLTGVVGPNGCGKSNLLEAMRWAMGEGSARSLRGAGMEDVIFAGTASRPARDFAEVSILAERDGAEIEVIRRIERGAGSAYRIDGRDARAKDVALLFADAATGAHSPALVSQGRIGAVIAARPQERRQMLEEAAGIAGLHVRRKDAEQKLRATDANLARLDELVADMDQRIASLRRQARAAERYRLLSAEIRQAEARLIFARWRDAAEAADRARAEAMAAEHAVEQAAEAQKSASTAQHVAARDLTARRGAAESTRNAAGAAGHALAAAQAEHAAVNRRLVELAKAAETLVRDRGREDALAIDAAAAIARLAQEEQELSAAIAAATAERAIRAAALAEADRTARDGELALAQAMAAEATELAEIRIADAAVSAARQRLDRAVAEVDRVERDRRSLPQPDALNAARDAALAARQAAEAEQAAATRSAEEAESAREAAAAMRDIRESEGSAARAALAAIDAEALTLTRALDSGKRNGATDSRALAQVRAAPGYERALGAALGDDLDAEIGGSGARRWSGAAADRDPALPPGTAMLAAHVTAPAALARRLAQVAVVDRDDGTIVLAVGQRLVSRDGRLRRWDGFVAEDVGALAAVRLVRINRLDELRAALPLARAAVETAQAGVAEAAATLAATRTTIERSRAARTVAEERVRRAGRDADAASAALDRLGAQRAQIDERAARAEADRQDAVRAVESAAAARAALPDGHATRRLVEGLRQAADASRRAVADRRAEAEANLRAIESDRRRLDSARSEARGWRSRAGDAGRRIAEMDERAGQVADEQASLCGRPEALEIRVAGLARDSQRLAAEAIEARQAEERADATLREADTVLAATIEALSAAREQRAGAAARREAQENRRIEASRLSGERFACPAPLLPERIGFVGSEVSDAAGESTRLDRLTADRERIGPVNLVAEAELAELETERATSLAERAELAEAIHRLRGSIGSLNREGRARLLAAFEAVDGHFRRLFTTLFEGGQARLALIDSDDPLEAGLEIMAQPPGKKLAALTLLSGGEQALTAVALIFGLFLTNPAPICVLDEVDAPLDDANIERFCDLLAQMSTETDTRYLVVTHNAVTMSRMHRLFGVTMIERGVSRLVSVDLGGAETLLAAA